MYDALTGRFTFPCPARGEARVTLSAFRQLERLPGGTAPSGLPVVLLPPRPGGRVARPGRALPDLSPHVGEPRFPRARRPALPQRSEGRGRGARVQRGRLPDGRGISGRALL